MVSHLSLGRLHHGVQRFSSKQCSLNVGYGSLLVSPQLRTHSSLVRRSWNDGAASLEGTSKSRSICNRMHQIGALQWWLLFAAHLSALESLHLRLKINESDRRRNTRASCCPMRPEVLSVVEDHVDLARILAMMFHGGCGGLRCCRNLHNHHNHNSCYSHVTAASMSTASICTFEIRDLSLITCRTPMLGRPCRPLQTSLQNTPWSFWSLCLTEPRQVTWWERVFL